MLKRQVVEGKVYVRRDGKITGPMQFDFLAENTPTLPQNLQFFDPVHKWYYDSWGRTGIDQHSADHPADLVGEFSNQSGSPSALLDMTAQPIKTACIDEKSGRVESTPEATSARVVGLTRIGLWGRPFGTLQKCSEPLTQATTMC